MPVEVKSDGPLRSEGERIVHDFLAANLPDSFQAWMNLELSPSFPGGIHQMEIDLILFHPQIGLLLCEIKDWRAKQICEVSRQSVHLSSGRQETNPSAALRQKFYAISTMFASRPAFSNGPRRVKMPINTVVCFPYITHQEWTALFDAQRIRAEDTGLPHDAVLFAEDLEPGGALASPTRAIQRLRRACTVLFPVSLAPSEVLELDNVLRGYISQPVPQIAILKKSTIRESVIRTQQRGGQAQQGAKKLLDILADSTRRSPDLLQLPNASASGISNCVVYSLNSSVRAATIHHDGVIYPMFCGSPSETEEWISQNQGATIAVDRATGRMTFTLCPTSESPSTVSASIALTTENIPLFRRLKDFDLTDLGLKRLEVRFLESIDEHTDPAEIDEVLADVSDSTVASLLARMISLLRRGEIEASQVAYDLYTNDALDAANAPALEAEALQSSANSDVICLLDSLPPAHVEAIFAPDHFQEWMLYLHPAQKEVVDFDTDRPMLITGVSGAGKTCILVHRARRLAVENPEARICILTLNRTLAELLRKLKSTLCADMDHERIEVYAYYDLFQKILHTTGADEYFSEYADLLSSNDHLAKVLQNIDPNACVNEFDPRSGETLIDTWEEFLAQRDDPIREAKNRLFSYLSEQQFAIDAEAYLRDEFQLIRTSFPLASREQRYKEFIREGRAITFLDTVNRPHRSDVLYLLQRYEEYMFDGGMLDEEGLTQLLLCRTIRSKFPSLPSELRFDHLLVDEFQDFSTVEINLLKDLPLASQNAFCVAGDTTQKVFVKQLKMMGTGLVDGSAQIFRIRKNFRNSKQILLAASKLNAHYGQMAKKQGVDIEILDPELAVRETAPPIACQADHEISVAWELATEWISDQQVDPWSVCIATAAPSLISADAILESSPPGVLADRITGDYMQRKKHMVVSNIAEVKGFEFSMIIIVGCSEKAFPNPRLPESESWRDALRLYVAMTRGRDQVALIYTGEPSACLTLMSDELVWHERTAREILKRRRPSSAPRKKHTPSFHTKIPKDSVFDLRKHGLTSSIAQSLELAGYPSILSLRDASDADLLKIRGLDRTKLSTLWRALGKHDRETGRIPATVPTQKRRKRSHRKH